MKYFSEDYRVTKDYEPTPEVISGAGGGCFPAGTFIRTAHGIKPIEACTPDDFILAYDRHGEIEYAKVTQLHVHKINEYNDDIYYIYHNEISLFPQGITGNHAVYDYVSQEHKEIKEFSIGDNLVDLDGNLIEITDIKIEAKKDTVYNLTVEPHHTFLIGDSNLFIRVHNGGGGKSSGGSARAAQEAPNTLQSAAIAKVLEVISHGEISGIVGGRKGVYFNGTQLQSDAGADNFANVFFDERKGIQMVGSPSQSVIQGFSNVENEVAITPTIVTSSVTQDLPDANIPQARVTISLPDGLWSQDKSNGDLNGYSISYSIAVQDTSSATWSTVVNKTISGKTTSAYELAHIVEAPTGAVHWRVRVTRITGADDASKKSTLQFARLTEIINSNQTYDKIAYVGLKIPAKEVGNSIPTRGYLVQGIKVPIPGNYNPTTRIYTGYWNFAWASTTQWTDNPAWILHDLIMNAEYGIQNFLGQTVTTDLTAFYEASLYNDCVTWNGTTNITNLIPDGQGGYEVRYKFNAVIATQQDAWQLLQAVASTMGAIIVHKNGKISLIQDRPKASVKILNNSNVINGTFLYSSTEATSRTTAINCTFNDKTDRYLPRTISEPSEDTLIAGWYNNAHIRYGYNVKDIVAYGCVTESQARRLAKKTLYTEVNQYDLVSFSLGLNVITISVGDVVTIMDNDYASDNTEYYAGRIVSASGTSITLDAPVTIIAGHTYTLGLASADYESLIERTVVTGAGITSTLTLDTALPAGDYTEKEFMLFSTGLVEPRDFLITSVTENEKGVYALSGIYYDINKYATIESGLAIVPNYPSRLISTQIPAVTNIQFSEVFMNDGIAANNYIGVTWDWSPATYTEGTTTKTFTDPVTYSIRWRRDNNPYKIENNITVKSFHIPDTTPGAYDVYIEVINLQGKKSSLTFGSYNYRITPSVSTLQYPDNFYVQGTSGIAFTGQNIALSWTYPAANDNKTDTLFDYILESWTTDGITKLRTYVIKPDYAAFLADGTTPNPYYKGAKYTYTYQDNLNDYGSASRSVQFKLYSRDMVGDVSTPSIKTFTNAVPAAISYTLTNGTGAAYINITSSPESDVTGYVVHRSTTNGFTPNSGTLVYDGIDTLPVIPGTAGTTYYYKAAAYDAFGKTGLNYGAQLTGALLSAEVDHFAFTGLTFTPNSPGTNQAAWTSGTVSINGAAPTTINSGNTTTWTSGTLYICFDKTSANLFVTNDITIAVTKSQIIASYRGGVDLKGGDGTAFFNGGQLLAQSVGANQLVADTAIITNTLQVQAGLLTDLHVSNTANLSNAKIANDLQSSDFNDTLHYGWKIDKQGNIKSYGSMILGVPGGPTSGTITRSKAYPLTLTATGSATVNGNWIYKSTGPTGWGSTGYSTESILGTGPITYIKFQTFYMATDFMLGLTEVGAGTGYANIDYALHIRGDNTIGIYENGTPVGTYVAYDLNTVFEIRYQSGTIYYLYNNNVIGPSRTVGTGKVFKVDADLYTVGAHIHNIEIGYYYTEPAPWGERIEIDGTGTRVYDRTNTLRVKLGKLT